MSEIITVQGRSDLIVSKQSKRTYFTITDQTQRRLICFDPSLYNECSLGADVELEVLPGKTADDTPKIERADSARPESAEKPKETFRLMTQDNKSKAFALAYAKDETVEMIDPEHPITMKMVRGTIKRARLYEMFLNGEMEIPDEEMIELVADMNKKES